MLQPANLIDEFGIVPLDVVPGDLDDAGVKAHAEVLFKNLLVRSAFDHCYLKSIQTGAYINSVLASHVHKGEPIHHGVYKITSSASKSGKQHFEASIGAFLALNPLLHASVLVLQSLDTPL